MENPYKWQGHRPTQTVVRPHFNKAKEILFKGRGACVLAGRGMGKSVFLRMLEQELEKQGNIKVLRIASPPPSLTVEDLLNMLAGKLGLSTDNRSTSQLLFEAFFETSPNTEMVVLLIDEFDRYAVNPAPLDQHHPGRAFFNDLETARRELNGRLAILAAGSIGTFVFRDILGSTFLSRAELLVFEALSMEDCRLLCAPFQKDNRPLADDVLQTLYLASGGVPALLTYGLQQIWDQEQPTPDHISQIFASFRVKHGEFVNDIFRSIGHEQFSEVPQAVWQLVKQTDGPVSRASLLELHEPLRQRQLRISLIDTLNLLQAAGLIKITGSVISDDPLLVRPVASILNLPVGSANEANIAERFITDLKKLLAQMHRLSVDFYRPDKKGEKTLVPENTLSAFLVLGLRMLGWQAEREAQSVAGRTDILIPLYRPGMSGQIIIEAKIWPRNDYKDIHAQVEGYCSEDTQSGIAVMFSDKAIPVDNYRENCLQGVRINRFNGERFPFQGHWETTSQTGHEITHFLLTLPR